MDAPIGYTQVKLKIPKDCFEDFERYFKNNIHQSRIERYEPVKDMFSDTINVLVWSNDEAALKVLRAVNDNACSVPDLRKELAKKKYLAASRPLKAAPKAKPTRVVKVQKPKAAPKKPASNIVLLKDKKGRKVASQVVVDNGGTINGSWMNGDDVITYQGKKYRFAHPVWDGKGNVRLEYKSDATAKKPMPKRQDPYRFEEVESADFNKDWKRGAIPLKNITSVGSENVYFVRNGKKHFSKTNLIEQVRLKKYPAPKSKPNPKTMATKKRKTVSPLQRMKRAARLLVKPTGIKADGTLKKGYTRTKSGDVVKRTLVKKCSTSAKKKTTRKPSKRK